MEGVNSQNVSDNGDMGNGNNQNGVPLTFFREESLFGKLKPNYNEYLKHEELYTALSEVIDPTHITGLQRVNGMWRIYLDNLADKAKLVTEGVKLRGRSLPILQTNPLRLDNEYTTRIRIQNIPLSVDDGTITRTLILKGIDVISNTREKLRIKSKLTNCETGDRIVLVKTLSLKEPLSRFMYFGIFKAKVIHIGQSKTTPTLKCSKCLTPGHTINSCENDWTCLQCKTPGHKKGSCPMLTHEEDVTSRSSDSASEAEIEDSVSVNTGRSKEKASRVNTDDKTRASMNPTSNPTLETPDGPRRKRSAKPGKRKSANKSNKGQTRIDMFVHHEANTPSKARSGSITRSPPTPAETLHDQSKKSRNYDSEYDSSD